MREMMVTAPCMQKVMPSSQQAYWLIDAHRLPAQSRQVLRTPSRVRQEKPFLRAREKLYKANGATCCKAHICALSVSTLISVCLGTSAVLIERRCATRQSQPWAARTYSERMFPMRRDSTRRTAPWSPRLAFSQPRTPRFSTQ